MAYHDNKNTNMNTSLPSSGKGGSTTSKINIKSIAKKFEKKVSKFIDKIPNNSNKTVNLYNTFGKLEDNIELNVYDVTDNLVSHTRDFKNYVFTEEGKQADGTSNEIIVNPEQDLRDLNFNSGQYKVEYRFQRRKIIDSFLKAFSIKEISNSRREIRIDTLELDNLQLEQRYNIFNEDLNESTLFKDFTLNFGNGINITAINIFLDKSDDDYSLLIKLLDPLPPTIANTFTLRIVEDLIEPAILTLNIEPPSLEDSRIQIAGPNFKIDTRLNSSIPSEFKTYDELLGGGITSSYENMINALSSSLQPSVEYDNLVTDSGYHFENFVHFSSATERLNNFKYKLKLIELYDTQKASISTITGNASSSVVTLSSKKVIENKRKKVIGGFDGYERFLYFESGTYSWPKSNSTKPYTQRLLTSSQALEWFGSNDGANDYYGGQIFSSSQFDNQNIYNLNKLIPEYIKNDSNNDQYKLFVDMIGQHFDQSWLYIKSLTENKRAENHLNKGIDKDLVYNALKGLGIQVFDEFENADLFEYLTGINKDGSLYHLTSSSSPQTLVTASNEGSLAKSDITREKWKRIYHNLPYLLKTKGTERGIRALITSYGIPSTILNVKEFGGSTSDSTSFKTFKYNKKLFNFKATTVSGDGSLTTNGFFIRTPWSSSLTNDLSASAKTVEFRIKPIRSATTYHLFSLSGSAGVTSDQLEYDQHLILEPYIGNDISSSGDSTQYGRLKWSRKNHTVTAVTDYFPVYNGDYWNIFIGTNAIGNASDTAVATSFGAYQANNLQNVYKVTQTSPTLDTRFQANTWGLQFPGANSTHARDAGATFCFIGGLPAGVANSAVEKGYSGSIQEIKYHFGELLSDDTLTKHALEPSMYNGNTPSSSYTNLVLRLPLGGNLKQNISKSIHPNINTTFLTNISSNTVSPKFKFDEEIRYLPTPDTVGKAMTSKKVRLDSGEVVDNILSPDIKTETSVLDRQPLDTNDLGVYFSPSFPINRDIIYTLGSFRLDDFIGDPTHINKSNYPDLKELKNSYFQKSPNRFDYSDFIYTTQQFDHTLFKIIETMVPAKANLKTGILIEPHYLERSKFANPSTLPGIEKHNNYEANYDIKYTSETSDFNLKGQNILTQTTFNISPESQYVSFDTGSNYLLNNAVSSRKSKKYFRTVTPNTEEF